MVYTSNHNNNNKSMIKKGETLLKKLCKKTSRDERHIHTYCRGNDYTSIDRGHKHKVINGIVQPNKSTTGKLHIHKLD